VRNWEPEVSRDGLGGGRLRGVAPFSDVYHWETNTIEILSCRGLVDRELSL